MKDINKLPKDFFAKERKTKIKNKEEYSKIEEIKWNKDILSGRNKIVGVLSK